MTRIQNEGGQAHLWEVRREIQILFLYAEKYVERATSGNTQTFPEVHLVVQKQQKLHFLDRLQRHPVGSRR
jgi:hypothetical protein